jgi:hypothetical protein
MKRQKTYQEFSENIFFLGISAIQLPLIVLLSVVCHSQQISYNYCLIPFALYFSARVGVHHLGIIKFHFSKSSFRLFLYSVGFGLLYWIYYAEQITINRDPGFYNLSFHLFREDSKTAALIWDSVDKFPAGFGADVPTITRVPGSLDQFTVQGAIGYQTFGSAAHTFLNEASSFSHVNALLGAFCIYQLYKFCEKFFPCIESLLCVTVVGISMPFVFLATSAYSELLTFSLILVFLNFLLQRDLQIKSMIPLDYLVIALSAFSISISRIDSMICFVAPIFLYFGISQKGISKFPKKLLFVGTLVTPTLLGLWVFYIYSPEYVSDLAKYHYIEFEAFIMIAFAVYYLSTDLIGLKVNNLIQVLVKYSIPILFVLYSLRPLISLALGNLNRNPIGNLDEFTLLSFYWYFGPLLYLLSFIGIWKTLRSPKFKVFSLPYSILVIQFLGYFATWQISPDQPWASRRLSTLGYPLLVFFAISILNISNPMKKFRFLSAAATTSMVLIPVLVISSPYFVHSNYSGLQRNVDLTCNAIQKNTPQGRLPVLLVEHDIREMTQTFRGQCNIMGLASLKPELDVQKAAAQFNLSTKKYYFIPLTIRGGTNYPLFRRTFKSDVLKPAYNHAPNSWETRLYDWQVSFPPTSD